MVYQRKRVSQYKTKSRTKKSYKANPTRRMTAQRTRYPRPTTAVNTHQSRPSIYRVWKTLMYENNHFNRTANFFKNGWAPADTTSLQDGYSFFDYGRFGCLQDYGPQFNAFGHLFAQLIQVYPGITHIKIGKMKVDVITNYNLNGDHINVWYRKEVMMKADILPQPSGTQYNNEYTNFWNRSDIVSMSFGSDDSQVKQHRVTIFDHVPTIQYYNTEVGADDRKMLPKRDAWIDIDYAKDTLRSMRLCMGQIAMSTPIDDPEVANKTVICPQLMVHFKYKTEQLGEQVASLVLPPVTPVVLPADAPINLPAVKIEQ